MSVSHDQMMHLLSRQLENTNIGSGIIGGRKKRGRPRKVGRPRIRGRGEYEDLYEDEYDGGGAMIGGRKKRMSAATKAYLADYKRSHTRKPRARGRGAMIGGASAQEVYEDMLASNTPMTTTTLKFLKSGIHPYTPKEKIIAQIQAKERRVYEKSTPKERLMQYDNKALEHIRDEVLSEDNMKYLSYPPTGDKYDRTRGRNENYENFEEPPREAARLRVPQSEQGQAALRVYKQALAEES